MSEYTINQKNDGENYSLSWQQDGFSFKQTSNNLVYITTGRKKTVLKIGEIYRHKETLENL